MNDSLNDSNNPRKEIQKKYADWVDEVCEMCDWKTSFGIDEVQAKYSELAIELVISELDSILETITDGKTAQKIRDRIVFLRSTIK